MRTNLLLFAVVIIAVVLLLMFFRARSILETWAMENSYEILSSDLRILNRGSYLGTIFGNQWVFRVTVRDHEGRASTGFVKCGGFWWGLFVNRAEVKWDE